jgi:hypothetical protein
MKKILDTLSSIGLPLLATAWTVAMINLWEWNVEGTGMWFAILMIIFGIVVFLASLAHTFKIWNTSWWQKLTNYFFFRNK